MIIPRARSRTAEFAAAVAEVERQLVPDVVRIRFTLGEDWTGDPAVFFKIVVPDDVFTSGRISPVSLRISQAITLTVEPLEEWGVMPYFNYRSESGQAKMNEPAWA